jgi:hypothetical protein
MAAARPLPPSLVDGIVLVAVRKDLPNGPGYRSRKNICAFAGMRMHGEAEVLVVHGPVRFVACRSGLWDHTSCRPLAALNGIKPSIGALKINYGTHRRFVASG